VLYDLENVEEAAQRLGLSPGRVRALLREGQLEGLKVSELKDQWFVCRDSRPVDPLNGYITVSQAAQKFGCGERRVRELARRGLLDAVKPGYCWWIPSDAVVKE
jgi:excisionase family DNA binding protein